MSRSRSPITEALTYFRDLGFEEVWPPVAGSSTDDPGPRRPEQKASAETAVPISEGVDEARGVLAPPAGAVLPVEAGSSTEGDAAERLAVLAARAAECRACRLHEGRQKVVFGSGSPDAEILFIGEGPGAEEDRRGLPFVGRAGELLTKIIEAIGLTREEVYIANVVKCRPPGNRDPQADEVAACRHYLRDQIATIEPRVIVALGRVAAQTLLGNDSPLGRMRGSWYEVEGVATRVTYHPAALLRNDGLKRPTWEDMKVVRDRLAEGAGDPSRQAPGLVE